ncbi:protein disulfide isomerase [Anaeramoeba ignava]|uniref:Protein disulfide isomerase n=1 Tax=Anaeramoeba ignava TaxID=1746090 RepID=A0A9Q0L6E6_ANAIG|nr:protein disulfide isomerase [Anaeramoeba ignava]
MIKFYLILLISSFFIPSLNCKKSVLDLNDQELEQVVGDYQWMVIYFHSKSSSKSIESLPVFEEVASFLNSSRVGFGMIDASDSQKLRTKYRLLGFPTIKIYKEGEQYDTYFGKRTSKDILQYIRGLIMPFLIQINSAQQAQMFSTSHKLSVIIHKPDCDDLYIEELKNIKDEEEMNEIKIGIVKNKEISEELHVKEFPLVEFYRDFSNKTLFLKSDNIDDLKSFIFKYRNPPYEELTLSNTKKYFSSSKPLSIIFLDFFSKDELLDSIEAISTEFEGEILFTWIEGPELQTFADKYGVFSFPSLVLLDRKNPSNFHRLDNENGKISYERLKDFFSKFLENKLSFSIKSEPIPKNQDSNIIKKVVYSNWDDIIMKPDHDVFLMIYSELCQECKEVSIQFEELAKKLSKTKKLTFAKIDGFKNNLKFDYALSQYPTMVLFTAKNKPKYIVYEGEKTSKSMAEFLKKNVSSKIKIKRNKEL